MKLIELTKKQYEGFPINMDYESNHYYKVVIDETNNRYTVSFIKQQFDKTFSKTLTSTLFEPHWDNPSAFGLFDNEKLIGCIEVNREEWSKRLRVTNISVDKMYKRKRYGKQLMARVKQLAKEEEYRMVILETQTCNNNAIEFYKSEGFVLHGFDASCYSNDDIIQNEVRMEWIYLTK